MKRFTVTLTLVAMLALLAIPALADSPTGTVNINTASAEQLQLLPRVGPSIAKRIIQFREDNGKFQKVEDVMLVRGIGEKTFSLLKPYLTVEGKTTLSERVPAPRRKK